MCRLLCLLASLNPYSLIYYVGVLQELMFMLLGVRTVKNVYCSGGNSHDFQVRIWLGYVPSWFYQPLGCLVGIWGIFTCLLLSYLSKKSFFTGKCFLLGGDFYGFLLSVTVIVELTSILQLADINSLLIRKFRSLLKTCETITKS